MCVQWYECMCPVCSDMGVCVVVSIPLWRDVRVNFTYCRCSSNNKKLKAGVILMEGCDEVGRFSISIFDF